MTSDAAEANADEAAEPAQWQADIPVGRSMVLPPDPHIIDAIGGNHRLETAVADLVDNSIDAGASHILIRFVRTDDRIQTFYVIDDGRGMDAATIDRAMTVGSQRAYGTSELGHFGLGLKASSFSQADSLTVLSVTSGDSAVGRRWLTAKASQSFECDVVDHDFASRELGRGWGYVDTTTGTIVRWDRIRTFPSTPDAETTSRFLSDAITRLQHHLGLVFHRFLARGSMSIGIDVEDATSSETGPVMTVKPLDPFGYGRSGANDYPKTLRTTIGSTTVEAVCHIWPGRSQLSQFRLPDKPADQYQGLYFYRRDRLLHAGGWNNIEVQRRELQLARMSIDLDDELVAARIFRMNPEKSRVESGHEFSDAIAKARADDGTTFADYLDEARTTFKRASERNRTRTPITPLGRGLPPRLRRTIKRELTFLPGEKVDIRWRNFADDTFFDVDREENTIWLNNRYRNAVAGAGRASFNDSPLVKTLLYMLVENLFQGSHWGPKDKDNIELWQAVLTRAAQEETR